MKYLWLLLLVMSACASKAPTEFSAEYAWKAACQFSHYSCEDVDPPRYVIGLPEEGPENVRGRYAIGVVYINPRLTEPVDILATAIHETVHHLQKVVLGHSNQALLKDLKALRTLCYDEEEAFSVGDRWLRSIRKPHLQRGSSWWYVYKHCHQFYETG